MIEPGSRDVLLLKSTGSTNWSYDTIDPSVVLCVNPTGYHSFLADASVFCTCGLVMMLVTSF